MSSPRAFWPGKPTGGLDLPVALAFFWPAMNARSGAVSMGRPAIRMAIATMLILVGVARVLAQPVTPGETTRGESGLPLPRFVSLASGEAHMRSGPGQQYPILWTYKRRGLPLLITAEYGNWRRVRDMDGTAGWMHSALLSGTRMGVITGGERLLRTRPAPDAPPIFRAEPGVLIEILSCENGWCRVALSGRRAYIAEDDFWGVFAGERLE